MKIKTLGHRINIVYWEIDCEPSNALLVRRIALHGDVGHIREGMGAVYDKVRRCDT